MVLFFTLQEVLTEKPQEPDLAVSVWEPMLCSEAEDGQAPLSLELLFHSARVVGPDEALVVAVHLLMLETGFTPQVTRQTLGTG